MVTLALGASSSTIILGELNQIPPVAPRILPDNDTTIRLIARVAFKMDSLGFERCIVAVEVVSFQKQPNAAASLISNRHLLVAHGAGEEDFGFSIGRRNANPAFAVPKVCVFAADEADTREKGEGFVIVRDEEREESDAGWRHISKKVLGGNVIK